MSINRETEQAQHCTVLRIRSRLYHNYTDYNRFLMGEGIFVLFQVFVDDSKPENRINKNIFTFWSAQAQIQTT